MPKLNQAAKQNIDDLALFGGRPAFEAPLHVNRPNVGAKGTFVSLLDAIWDSKWFTNDGPVVRDLEGRLRDYLGVRHCVLTSSGTVAMAILLRALDLKGAVIIPSFSFISTAHALTWAGMRPVFCDIDARTMNMSAKHCTELIDAETSAVIPTHVWGNACEVDVFVGICAQAGIELAFDAAHAFGCTYKGQMIGGFGAAEVFSFHATKVFHTFEGGAVTTNDAQLARRLRSIRNFGFSDYDRVDTVGLNAKMSEIHAAMGIANLEAIDTALKQAQSVYEAYKRGLRGIEGVRLVPHRRGEQSNWHYAPAWVDAARFGLSRDELVQLLHAENVLARRYFYPGAHEAEPYRHSGGNGGWRLPSTVSACEKAIVFPAGASCTREDVSRICELVSVAAANAGEISARLSCHGSAGARIE